MRKTWARLALIVAVLCAAGFGWIYHQHGSGSTHWLAALDNQTAITEKNSVSTNSSSSSTSDNIAQATGGSVTSPATNTGRSLSNVTTGQAKSSASDTAPANITQNSTTRSSGTGTSQTSNAATATRRTNTTENTSTNTKTVASTSAKTPGASTNSTGENTTNSTGTSNTTQMSGSFTIIVSENHGQTVIAKKTVAIHSGENLMQYMEQNFTIETVYSGGFITSIDGIKSQWTGVPVDQRKPVDWFLYINQEQAPVGAESIVPRKGDIDDWDYHSWNPSTGQG